MCFNARAPISDIARKLRVKPHLVRYALEYLTPRLNLRPCLFTDPFRQGLTPYRIYFSLSAGQQSRIQEMIAHLSSLPHIAWFGCLYGYYQFIISFRAANIYDLNRYLSEVDERFGDLIQKKVIGVLTRFAHFTPWLAHSGSGPRASFEYSAASFEPIMDEIDQRVLLATRNAPLAAVAELARTAGLPASTVTYRMNKLVKERIILAFSYTYDSDSTGAESYLILIALQGLGGDGFERIFEFARNHPKAMWAAKTLGEWNMEIEVSLEDPYELHDIVQQIHKVGKGAVREAITLVWGRDFKV
jgi:DNA-binding Lrp family transcriptional regulator